MLDKINPDKTKAWKNLTEHYSEFKNVHMKDLFKKDPERFNKFSIKFNNILVDYSKNRIDEQTLELLLDLACEVNLKDAINKMFSGDFINETENRSVLHTALRNRSNTPIFVKGRDIIPDINAVLEKMETFSSNLISGKWKGYTSKKVTDIVNIGIGGSDLGPVMVTECLKP
ncbi:MAG: glucose-6-phosphate isomerase, partial [Desulfobacula sp.]|nr:glucose-6-phosphate isomerase [Desulfobacula sp.]